MLLRAGVDKLLKSDAVMGALRRQAGRYVDVLDLGCSATDCRTQRREFSAHAAFCAQRRR